MKNDIIRFEGDNSCFLWLYPKIDISSNSRLMVAPDEKVAVCTDESNLEIIDDPGVYTLNPDNCSSKYYFIKKDLSMNLKWGMANPGLYYDKTYDFNTSFTLFGTVTLKVNDAKTFLSDMLQLSQDISENNVSDCIRKNILNDGFSSFLIFKEVTNQLNTIFEIDEKMDSMVEKCKISANDYLGKHGLSVVDLSLIVGKPDGDENYEKFKKVYLSEHPGAIIDNNQANYVAGNVSEQVPTTPAVSDSQNISQRDSQISSSNINKTIQNELKSAASNAITSTVKNIIRNIFK